MKVKVAQSCLTLHSPWNSPGQNTGVGSLSFLQGIFPTQGWSPGLPCYSWILYQLSHEGSPIYNIFTHFLSPKRSFFFLLILKFKHLHESLKSINTLAPGTTVTGSNGYVSLCRTCLVTFLGGLGWSGDTLSWHGDSCEATLGGAFLNKGLKLPFFLVTGLCLITVQ